MPARCKSAIRFFSFFYCNSDEAYITEMLIPKAENLINALAVEADDDQLTICFLGEIIRGQIEDSTKRLVTQPDRLLLTDMMKNIAYILRRNAEQRWICYCIGLGKVLNLEFRVEPREADPASGDAKVVTP